MAKAAYKVALATLPDYSHRFSPQKFTQSQLFVCLTLKTFFKTDYRGIVSYLRDLSDLRRAFHLTVVPHYTTLQKAAKRLLAVKSADRLLEATVTTLCEDKRVALAAIDSTGWKPGIPAATLSSGNAQKTARLLKTPPIGVSPNWRWCAIVSTPWSCQCSPHAVPALTSISFAGP